jgi:hypothetical protein
MSSYDDTYYSLSVPSSGFDFATTNIFSIEQIASDIAVTTSVVSDVYIYSYTVESSISVNTDVVSDANIYSYVIESEILSNSSTTSDVLIVNSINSGISVLPNASIDSAALIVNLSSSISILPNVTVALSTVDFYVGIASNISSSSKTLVSSIDILRTGLVEDSGDIKPFFVLDGIPLSEHNRTSSFADTPKYIINSNWTAKKGVYFKTSKNKRSITIEWSFLPGKRDNTVDFHAGRDVVKAICSDPRSHILKVRNLDTDGLTIHTNEEYNVLVMDYSETLIRRDLNNNEYYWNCSLSLQEV